MTYHRNIACSTCVCSGLYYFHENPSNGRRYTDQMVRCSSCSAPLITDLSQPKITSLANSLATVIRTWPMQAPNIPSNKSHVPLSLLRSYQNISPGSRQVFKLRNKASFYGEELSTPRPTPKLEDQPLSAVRGCSFNLFTSTLHIAGRTSIRNLRTRHAVVTWTHLSRVMPAGKQKNLAACSKVLSE